MDPREKVLFRYCVLVVVFIAVAACSHTTMGSSRAAQSAGETKKDTAGIANVPPRSAIVGIDDLDQGTCWATSSVTIIQSMKEQVAWVLSQNTGSFKIAFSDNLKSGHKKDCKPGKGTPFVDPKNPNVSQYFFDVAKDSAALSGAPVHKGCYEYTVAYTAPPGPSKTCNDPNVIVK